MYKQKKKRNVNPDIIRPNLFSHEKTIKEQIAMLEQTTRRMDDLNRTVHSQQTRINNLENTVAQLMDVLRKR